MDIDNYPQATSGYQVFIKEQLLLADSEAKVDYKKSYPEISKLWKSLGESQKNQYKAKAKTIAHQKSSLRNHLKKMSAYSFFRKTKVEEFSSQNIPVKEWDKLIINLWKNLDNNEKLTWKFLAENCISDINPDQIPVGPAPPGGPSLPLVAKSPPDKPELPQAELKSVMLIKPSHDKPSIYCDICIDKIKNRVLNCGHTLCAGCAAKILTCHVCRQKITIKIPMFL